MVIIKRCILYYYYYYYYFQIHVSASSFVAIFRLKRVAGNNNVKYIF